MAEQPFVSVIVPVWNSPDAIVTCLRALQAQTYPRDRFEVIVVDNGSSDSTAAAARGVGFGQVVSEPEPGSYRARNRGLQAAAGEYVAFTDADCVPDPRWLERAVATALAHPQAGIVAGHVQLFACEAGGDPACVQYEQMFGFRQQANARVGRCVTANWFSRRDLILELGGFNDRMKSGGDWELARRISATGRTVVYAPDVIVGHPARGSFQELAMKRRRVVGGRWALRQGPLDILKILYGILRDGLGKLKFVLVNSGLGWRERIRVALIAAALPLVACFEWTRLLFGGQPRRS